MIGRRRAAIGGRIVFGSSAIGERSDGTGVQCGKARGADALAVTAAPDQVAVVSVGWTRKEASGSTGDRRSVRAGQTRVDKAYPGVTRD
jgi:hypothetical protein